MLKTFVRHRGTGKTTEVIAKLRAEKSAIVLVHATHLKGSYPDELHQRVFTVEDYLNGWRLEGLCFNKIILDEGFILAEDVLAKFIL